MSLKKLSAKLFPFFIETFTENFYGTCRLFLSASDMKEKAIVRHAAGETPEEAWEKSLAALEEILNQKDIEPSILRADWVISSETSSWADFLDLISSKARNWFRQGIALDKNYQIAFTEQELNANLILSDTEKGKSKGEFQPERAEKYCLERFGCEFPQLSDEDELEIFDTNGIFIQEGMRVPLNITGKWMNAGRRDFTTSDYRIFFAMAMNAANYLARQCDADGKFIYGLYPCDEEEIPDYNTHRHFGTIFSLAEAYEVCTNENDKKALGDAIERSLEYGIRNFLCYRKISYKEDAIYFREDKITTIGISGLALLAFAKWTTASGTKKYIPLMNAVARGILALQKSNGNFTHILNVEDFSVKKEFGVNSYDGEALFGLMRLYGITKDSKILEAVERAVNYFIKAKYWEKHNHWMQHSLNELTIYKPKAEYFKFGLDNISSYLIRIYESTGHTPTQLEMIVAEENMIRRMNYLPEMENLLRRVDGETFYSTLNLRAERLRNSYFWSEMAMYFPKPERIAGSFYIRSDAFRIRIDDVQHSISGMISYSKFLKGEKVPFEPIEYEIKSPLQKTETKSSPSKAETKSPSKKVEPAKSQSVTKSVPPFRVGIMRKNKNIWKSQSATCAQFYIAKNFNMELLLFTPKDIDFKNKTVRATMLEGNKKIERVVPLPKIIDNPASILNGEYGKDLRQLDCYFTRQPMDAAKKKVYDLLAEDGILTDFLIDTHIVKDFNHFLELFQKYEGDIVLKTNGGANKIGVTRISREGEKYFINFKNEKFFLDTDEELLNFYNENFTAGRHVLQPYISSRTRQGNPFNIRVHARRGAEGKFKVHFFPRIGNADGLSTNISGGGFWMDFETFLQTEFGEDWKMLFDRFVEFGDIFPEYYQSFFSTQLFDLGVDVAIQRRENSYRFKIFEISTFIDGSFFEIEDAVTHFEYYRYIDQKLRERSK